MAKQTHQPYQLICEEQYSLQAEFTVAELEKVLEQDTQKVHHHSIIITFSSEPSDTSTPTPPARVLSTLDSYSIWGCLAFTDLGFIPTSSAEMMLIPQMPPETESVSPLLR